jgi:hypothetical protein
MIAGRKHLETGDFFWECGGQKGGLFLERKQQVRKMRKLGIEYE